MSKADTKKVVFNKKSLLNKLDFFTFLPRRFQDEVETVLPTVKYYSTRVSCPDKDCDGVYGNRVTPVGRDKLKCE